jgi:manganese-dependent inorganic pyrophosphatase
MQTIVIGHRNPDMDSICSAIAYARLKEALGETGVVAARAGDTNARIDYVLGRFGAPPPVFLANVAPRVVDVMESTVASVTADAAIYDAVQLLEQRRLRGLPVVDGGNRCLGLLSAFKVTHHLFPPRAESSDARRVHASLGGIARTLGARALAGELDEVPDDLILIVGAMNTRTSAGRLGSAGRGHTVFFVGDRDEVQRHAIAAGVRAIVVTGGMPVHPDILRAASAARVPVLGSPHDTATSVLLARGAAQISRMIDTDFASFHPDTPLEVAREQAATSPSFVFPVLDADGKLCGVLSKSDFIKPVPRRLILVDHNELAQAVPGADKVPVVEVLDHHRLGGFTSDTPIHFWNNPVGSTCTLVALSYRAAGIAIPPGTAGLLMAGLISDTLNLSSPTATPVDRRVLDELAGVAGVAPAELAEAIFSVGSPLHTQSPAEVVTSDCKEYSESGMRFTVSQIEELNFSHFEERREALFEALDAHVRARGLHFAALLVTDVNTRNSLLLASGDPALLARIDYPPVGPRLWQLDGVVSRKKQLLPQLLRLLGGPGGA